LDASDPALFTFDHDRSCLQVDTRQPSGHALANSGRVNKYQLQSIMRHRDQPSTRVYVQGVAGLIKGLWD
jgi:hypothetical protein